MGLAEENPKYLDYWKETIEEKQEKERPQYQSWELSDKVKTFNEFDGKIILSFIRNGDYTHAGEEEALDLIMSYFPKDKNRKILDVACGLGGTADYLQKNGWGEVIGFDIDEEAIRYAKEKYSNESFFISDVSNISNHFEFPNFDLICIVNSFVCFPEQYKCLKELRKLAKLSTKLVIFEYTDLIGNDNPLAGNGKNISFKPIKPDEISSFVNKAGWEITTYVNLDEIFEAWYWNFLKIVESKRPEIDEQFGKNTTNYIRGKYDLIYYGIKNKWIGGCLMILSPKK